MTTPQGPSPAATPFPGPPGSTFAPVTSASASATASPGVWDRITKWASENKALVYTVAGAAIVVTSAGAVYYFSGPKTTAQSSEKKKSKKQRRAEKKRAEEEKNKPESAKQDGMLQDAELVGDVY